MNQREREREHLGVSVGVRVSVRDSIRDQQWPMGLLLLSHTEMGVPAACTVRGLPIACTHARARSLAPNSPGMIFDLLQSASEKVIIICLRNSA